MLDVLQTYLTKGTSFYGLEVYEIEVSTKFRLLEVSKKKGELVLADSKSFEDKKDLGTQLNKALPVYLIYNTGDVITKRSGPENTMESKALVSQIFPGLDFENFHFQIAKLKEKCYVSIAKKQNVGHLIERLRQMGLQIAGFSLGISSLSHLVDYMEVDVFCTNTAKYSLETGSNADPRTPIKQDDNVTSYSVNGLEIENTELLAFSGVLGFLENASPIHSNFTEMFGNLQQQYTRNRTFKLLLRSSLSFILTLLLVNFLYFNFYFEKVQLSQENLTLENENKKKLAAVSTKVSEKERKLEAVSSLSNSKASLYLDKLCATIPKSVLLGELVYQPLAKPVQASKPIQLEEQQLLIMGTSGDSEAFSSWIEQLESQEWVTSVETTDYDYKSRNTSEFRLKLHVTHP